MSRPGLELTSSGEQFNINRLAGRDVRAGCRTQLGASGKVDFDSDCTQRRLGRVPYRSFECARRRIERQYQSRATPGHVPGVASPDVYTRFLALLRVPSFGVLTTLGVLSALTSLPSFGVLEFRVTGLAGLSNVCLWLP